MLTVIVDGELKVLSVRRKTKGEYKLKVLFRPGGREGGFTPSPPGAGVSS